MAGLALDPKLAAAGVRLQALGDLVASEDALARELLAGGSIPVEERFAELSCAAWTQGILLHVPDGVVIEAPVVLRWTPWCTPVADLAHADRAR